MNFYLSKEPVMYTSEISEHMHVLIFKTNIQFKKDLKIVEQCLEKQSSVREWNIDREDIDKVLRVESTSDITKEIISSIKKAGFFCEEL